ncbi:MAG: hypothetical protein WDN72_04635 [Alphaproteobacteria bacterium]
MKRNWRTHAIAIGSICVLVLALYFVFGPKKQAAVIVQTIGDRYIQIYTATWGRNCNDSIDQYNQELAQHGFHPATNTTGNTAAAPVKPLAHVAADNVLGAVGTACDHQLTCKLTADSKTLGVEPIVSCFKHLAVGYRCYTYDKLSKLEVSQGDTLSIDCSGDAPAPNGPSPTNK